jgi:hypothetical protein
MKKLSLAQLALLTIILALSVMFVPSAHSTTIARPTITSQWTTQPPTIDGAITQGEWSNLQITFDSSTYPTSYVLPTYVYFLNDKTNLYVLVDAVGDTHDNSLDQCLLVFGFDPNPNNLIKIRIIGASGTHMSAPPFEAAIGFGGSPQNSALHKIYEFSIPFTYINGQPGQPLVFSSPPWKGVSMPFDQDTGHDNVWPLGWSQSDVNTYGSLGTAPSAIPEYPLGLPILAMFMILAYGLIRRRTSIAKQS